MPQKLSKPRVRLNSNPLEALPPRWTLLIQQVREDACRDAEFGKDLDVDPNYYVVDNYTSHTHALTDLAMAWIARCPANEPLGQMQKLYCRLLVGALLRHNEPLREYFEGHCLRFGVALELK